MIVVAGGDDGAGGDTDPVESPSREGGRPDPSLPTRFPLRPALDSFFDRPLRGRVGPRMDSVRAFFFPVVPEGGITGRGTARRFSVGLNPTSEGNGSGLGALRRPGNKAIPSTPRPTAAAIRIALAPSRWISPGPFTGFRNLPPHRPD